MLRRLRIKFVCINMAIVTLMLGVIFSVLYLSTMNSLERESIQMMQSIAARPVELGPPNQPPEEVRLPYLVLRLGQGGELLETGGSYFDLSDEAAYRELLEAAEERKEPVGVLSEYGLRYCRNSSPAGESIVFSDISNEQSMLGHLMRTSILIGAAAFLAFLGISVLLARWAVRPVETAWNQQKQFVADASHELKTPLTVILTNAELLSGPDCGERERKRFSGSILTMAENLIRLSGLVPYWDIDIKEIGLRPGEKLYEELLMSSETLSKTENSKIFVEEQSHISGEELNCKLSQLDDALNEELGREELIELMHRLVPTYRTPEEVNSTEIRRREAEKETCEDRSPVCV